MRPALALLLLLAASCFAPGAGAQVRRCVDAQGNSVYTDRACMAMDATPKEAPVSHAGAYTSGFASRGCARSPDQLLDGVRGALEARDVNRLANYYHWTGTGTGAARHLMDSLEAIAARPLVNAQLVYPEVLPELDAAGFPLLPEQTAAQPSPARMRAFAPPADPRAANLDAGPVGTPLDTAALAPVADAARGEGAPRPDMTISNAAGPPPDSLLVEQMSGASDAASAQVRFGLRRNAGCWWIQL